MGQSGLGKLLGKGDRAVLNALGVKELRDITNMLDTLQTTQAVSGLLL